MTFRIIVHRIFRYLRFWLLSVNEHSLQVTFLYGLYTRALKSAKNFPVDPAIETIRANWQNSSLEINQLTSGTESTVSNPQKVSQIARYGISDPKSCITLCEIAHYLDCRSILEIGTSLGITTHYLAELTIVETLVSIDSNKELMALAKQTLKDANTQIELITADADDAIVALANREATFDMVYVDANHTYEATIRYFKQLKHVIHDESVIIFDDINWSVDMTKAWEKILSDQHVMLSIENYEMGIIFFDTKYAKKSVVLDF